MKSMVEKDKARRRADNREEEVRKRRERKEREKEQKEEKKKRKRIVNGGEGIQAQTIGESKRRESKKKICSTDE